MDSGQRGNLGNDSQRVIHFLNRAVQAPCAFNREPVGTRPGIATKSLVAKAWVTASGSGHLDFTDESFSWIAVTLYG
jgi:hypothetical protein